MTGRMERQLKFWQEKCFDLSKSVEGLRLQDTKQASLNPFAGANTVVRKSIVDKNARIGSNVQIVNKAGVREANRENEGWVIKDGITIIIKDSTIPDGTII